MNQRWRLTCLVGLLLLGFGLRVYQLDDQSMWSDEGLSVYRARQPLPDLLGGTIVLDGQPSQDTNPPLYFLLLGGLRALAGESVFSLRYLGVLIAVLNLPLLYQIRRRVGGWQVGLGAVFWLMLSPLHVWQSQEMRNYTLLLFWNLLSVYALSQIVLSKSTARKGSVVRWGTLWATAVLAGVYTHYFGLFVLAFGVLVLFVWGVQRWQGWPPPRWAIWTVMATGLVALPVLWVALARFRGVPQVDFVFVPPHHFLNHVFSAFSVGIQKEVVHPWWRVAPVVLLAGWGVVRLWRAGRKTAALFLMGYWFLPLFLLETLSYFNPLYNGARHLIMSLPPFLLLLGTAVSPTFSARSRPQISWLRPERIIVTLLSLSVMVSQVDWLHEQFTAEALVKDDIKGLAQFLSEVAQTEDVIVLHAPIIGCVFDYYYEGSAPWTAVPAWDQRDPEEGVQNLQAAAQGKQRVWFVVEPKPRIAFPRDVLPDWAAENWVPVWRQRFSALWLSTAIQGYIVDPVVTTVPPEANRLSVNWTNQLQLKGVEWPEAARAGAFWQPRFYWSRSQGDVPDVALSVRLVDPQGQVWHQADQPLWTNFPPELWPADAMIQVQPIIPLPAGLPPGDYQVVLRLVDQTTFQPIATTEQQVDLAGLARLTVQSALAPVDLAQLPEHVSQPVRLNRELELLGYKVPDEQYRPGHLVPIELFWRVWRQPEADYRLLVEMVDEHGTVTQSITAHPTRADYRVGGVSFGVQKSGHRIRDRLVGKVSLTTHHNGR